MRSVKQVIKDQKKTILEQPWQDPIRRRCGRFMVHLEVRFWRVAKWIIRRGYGADCETSDIQDFKYKTAEDVFSDGRCASCRAKEVIDWIDIHIALIQ